MTIKRADVGADFDQFLFTHGGKARPVYWRGKGPGVIVCHELPGLSRSCLDFARRLASKGFTVFVPLLFGKAGQGAPVRGAVQVCLTREFTVLATGKTSPISAWIEALAGAVRDRTKRSEVGAVGMCVTGGIVLPILLSDDVRAVVASQPSLPFAPAFLPLSRRADLGLPEDVIGRIRGTKKPVLGLRFERDWICPRERLTRLKDDLAAERYPVPSASCGDHSVLTMGYDRGRPGTDGAFDRVVDFLTEHLSGPRDRGASAPTEGEEDGDATAR